MMNFLFGGSEGNEDQKQSISLVDNDVMEKKAKKKKKPTTKTVAEASKAADEALQATQKMTDAMSWWADSKKDKSNPQSRSHEKKAAESPPTREYPQNWWKAGGSDDISLGSDVSGLSGLDLNLGLDEIEEFRPISEVRQSPIVKLNVLKTFKDAEEKIEKEKKIRKNIKLMLHTK